MLGQMHAGVAIKMSCGHEQSHNFGGRNRGTFTQQTAAIRTDICADCKDQARQLLLDACEGESPYPLKLRDIRGTPAQRSYATSLRSKVVNRYEKTLTMLAKVDTDLSNNLWRSIFLCLAPDTPSYWITRKDPHACRETLDSVIVHDMAYLYRPPVTGEQFIYKSSAYLEARNTDPHMIIRLKEYRPHDGLEGRPFLP